MTVMYTSSSRSLESRKELLLRIIIAIGAFLHLFYFSTSTVTHGYLTDCFLQPPRATRSQNSSRMVFVQ